MRDKSRIKLVAFNGTRRAPSDCDPQENYWALIGQSGTIVRYCEDMGRYLVQFDKAVKDFGLHCHNEVPNSLYIAPDDLEMVGKDK
jgi:hypothetical protein